jgi:hypothetical protein
MMKWWDRLFRRKASFDEWIDSQLASGRSMSDLVFLESATPVEWLRGIGSEEPTWAVPSGLQGDSSTILFAIEIGIMDKVHFLSGHGRGGREEVGKIVGERVVGEVHYWLIDFDFDGCEDFDNTGEIKFFPSGKD